jgi:translocation and assembly module TamA
MRFLISFLIIIACLAPSWLLAETIIRYDIDGLKEKPLDNVKAALDGAQKTAESKNQKLDKDDIQRLFYSNQALIKTAIQPYGYFAPTIVSSYKKTADDEWQLIYHINPGPGIRLTQVKIDIIGPGKDEATFATWENKFPLKVGDVFKSQQYTDGKQSFYAVANKIGYIRARLQTHVVKINLNDYTASIHLIYNTGQQFFFGPIQFGKSRLKDSFLRKFLTVQTGEAYSIPKLLQSQQNLSNSGYFTDVSIEQGKKIKKHAQIPLAISLREIKQMQYVLGAGYGTDTGYRGQVGWNWRLINSSGDHLQTNYSLSQIGSNFGTTYYIPGSNPLTEQYAISANTADYTTDAGKSNLQRYGVNYTRNAGYWQFTSALSYQIEKFSLTSGPEQNAHLLMPSVTWLYLYTDSALHPTYGLRMSINIQGAAQPVLSDLSFVQYQLDVRSLLPINDRNRFFLRGNIAGTFTDHFELLPLSLRFTAGGAQSVRGYAYQSLGPAKNLLVMSGEYQFRVYKKWHLAYFQDLGNAFNDANNMDLQHSQGVGIVWQSPIGTMELDYAKSITQKDKAGMIQFSMGSLL